jgi:hypothetical protein
VADAGGAHVNDLGHSALQQVRRRLDELGQLGTIDLMSGFRARLASLVIGRLLQSYTRWRARQKKTWLSQMLGIIHSLNPTYTG